MRNIRKKLHDLRLAHFACASLLHGALPLLFMIVGTLMPRSACMAQRHEILNRRITCLQVVAEDRWQDMPVAFMGETVHVSFDDQTHDYQRFCYKIEHCDADWQPSQGLFASDFMQGSNSILVIDNTEQSLNTNHLYTHYSLSIPNEQCRLTMSGNYRLTVYVDDDVDNPVFTACFMLVDSKMNVGLSVSGNTDVDIYNSHQQVAMTVQLGDVHVSDPLRQLKTVVLQNGRWDNAVFNARPDYQSADALQWMHNKALVFDAGNEYHKFEMLDMDHTTMGLDSIRWDGSEVHVFVQPDLPRMNYVYDEAATGAFYVRNSDNVDNDYTSDYAWVHFFLKAPRQPNDVYLNGAWTYDRFLPIHKMEYDEVAKGYRAQVLLKQGYYSYQYLQVDADGETSLVPTEGSFYPTKNAYQTLVYYRGTTDRADQLVGYNQVRVKVAQ